MNYFSGVKYDWNLIKSFLVTAESESFSEAASALGCSQATISRHVVALEEYFGVSLFERTYTGIVLTQDGAVLLEDARKMATIAEAIEININKHSKELTGSVTISAPEIFGTFDSKRYFCLIIAEQTALLHYGVQILNT